MSNIIVPRMFGQMLNLGHWSTDGLVFYWRGIEAGEVIDESFYRNHGTITGATWAGDGLSFDGNDYVDLGITEFQDGTSLFAEAAQQWTVIVRAKVASGDGGTFFAKAGAESQYRTFQFLADQGEISVRLRGGSSIITTDTVDGLWHTYVVVWDGSVGRAYADGTLRNNNLLIFASVEETTENIIIGARTSGAGWLLTGDIDFCSVYGRALSLSELTELEINPDLPMYQEPAWRGKEVEEVGGIPILRRRRECA